MSDVRNSQAWKETPWRAAETAYDDRTDDVRAPGWEEAAAATEAAALVPHDAPLAPDAVTGNLRRYARWQWKDYWQRRGFWLAGAAMFCVWVLVHYWLADQWKYVPGSLPNTMVRRLVPLNPDEVFGITHACFGVGGVLAGLLGVGGLVSRERERGLQRFLFAKPISALRYYLQGFAINSVGSALVLAGAILVAALTAGHALSVLTLVAIALGGYLLGAGATFLVSTLWRFDAPVAAAYLLAGLPVVALAENGYWWAKPLQWLFPHAPAVGIMKWFDRLGPMATAGDFVAPLLTLVLLAAVYGLGFLAAGVMVLRRRAIQP